MRVGFRPASGTFIPGFVPQLGISRSFRSAHRKFSSFLLKFAVLPPLAPLTPLLAIVPLRYTKAGKGFAPLGVHRYSSFRTPCLAFFYSIVRFAAPSSHYCIEKKSSLWVWFVLIRCYLAAAPARHWLHCVPPIAARRTVFAASC